MQLLIYDKQAKRARLPASVAKKWGLSSQYNAQFQQLLEDAGAELGYGKALGTTADSELRGKSKLNRHRLRFCTSGEHVCLQLLCPKHGPNETQCICSQEDITSPVKRKASEFDDPAAPKKAKQAADCIVRMAELTGAVLLNIKMARGLMK